MAKGTFIRSIAKGTFIRSIAKGTFIRSSDHKVLHNESNKKWIGNEWDYRKYCDTFMTKSGKLGMTELLTGLHGNFIWIKFIFNKRVFEIMLKVKFPESKTKECANFKFEVKSSVK